MLLKNICHKNGYAKVSLLKNGKSKQANVHRLVAEHFLPNPMKLPQVNHKDGNKHNPEAINLEWVTPKQNSIHAYENGLSKCWRKGLTGNKSANFRGAYQISFDGKHKKWDCISDAVREYGFDSGGITKCCQKKSVSHKGCIWVYEEDFSEEEKISRLKMLPDKIKRISNEGGIKFYDSPKHAEDDGFNRTGIIGCCKGYYKTSLGYKWEYIDHISFLEETKRV